MLRGIGFSDDTIAQVQCLVRKDRLKADPESQTLEDVACLVFLAHYFDDFRREYADEKVVNILRKTWRKMSHQGHAAAGALSLSEEARYLVQRALGEG